LGSGTCGSVFAADRLRLAIWTGPGHYVVSAFRGDKSETAPYRWSYVITVSNPGPCDATDVLVTDVLPQEFLPNELQSRVVVDGSTGHVTVTLSPGISGV
jgi:uncharacterized protein DUF11